MKMVKEFPDFPKDVDILSAEVTIDKDGNNIYLSRLLKTILRITFYMK